MTLRRRTFLGLAASLLPASAFAFETEFGKPDGNPPQEREEGGAVDYMGLRLSDNTTFAARNGLVVTEDAAYWASFRGRVAVRDENKIGILRDIPFAGQLFTPRLRGKDFDADNWIGNVYRLGDVLVVDLHVTRVTLQTKAAQLMEGAGQPTGGLKLPPLSGPSVPVQSLVAANQTVSYHVNGGAFAAVRGGDPPTALQALASGVEPLSVGEAYRLENSLLLLVRPSILTGWS